MRKQCIHPIAVRVPDYTNANPIGTILSHYRLVPCGKCLNCLENDQNDWIARNMLEMEFCQSAYFITLTYNDEHLPHDGQLVKKDLQRFLNTLRKRLERKCKEKDLVPVKLTYFGVGEYGRQSNRAHYHLLLYDYPLRDLHAMLQEVERCWNYRGFCQVKWANKGNIAYVCKYMTKIDPRPHEVLPFVLCHGDLHWVSASLLLPIESVTSMLRAVRFYICVMDMRTVYLGRLNASLSQMMLRRLGKNMEPLLLSMSFARRKLLESIIIDLKASKFWNNVDL